MDDLEYDETMDETEEVHQSAVRRVGNAKTRIKRARTQDEYDAAIRAYGAACGYLSAVTRALACPWEFSTGKLVGLGLKLWSRYGGEIVERDLYTKRGLVKTYAELVRLGKQAAPKPWVLGDLALLVGKDYGEDLLGKYAEDIGVEYSTLKEYRYVAQQYETDERSSIPPWSIYKVFAAEDDRLDLIADGNPDTGEDWRVADARALVRARRAEAKAGQEATVRRAAIKAVQDETEDEKLERETIESEEEAEDTFQLWSGLIEEDISEVAKIDFTKEHREQLIVLYKKLIDALLDGL